MNVPSFCRLATVWSTVPNDNKAPLFIIKSELGDNPDVTSVFILESSNIVVIPLYLLFPSNSVCPASEFTVVSLFSNIFDFKSKPVWFKFIVPSSEISLTSNVPIFDGESLSFPPKFKVATPKEFIESNLVSLLFLIVISPYPCSHLAGELIDETSMYWLMFIIEPSNFELSIFI